MHYATILGYEKGEDGNPKIVIDEAGTVKLIYDLFLDGLTYRKIAETLSERGLKNAKGSTDWTHSNVASILQNEKYTGDALLQKTFVTDCITKKVKKNNYSMYRAHTFSKLAERIFHPRRYFGINGACDDAVGFH